MILRKDIAFLTTIKQASEVYNGVYTQISTGDINDTFLFLLHCKLTFLILFNTGTSNYCICTYTFQENIIFKRQVFLSLVTLKLK